MGTEILMGAEDKFPIFTYIIVKADIHHLFAELALIDRFADKDSFEYEAGYRLIELESALKYISTLDWDLRDKDGILMPLSTLEDNLISGLNVILESVQSHFKQPHIRWLANILLQLSQGGVTYKPFLVHPNDIPNYKDSIWILGAVLKQLGLHLQLDGVDLKLDESSQHKSFSNTPKSIAVVFDISYPRYVYRMVSESIRRSHQI